MERISQLVANNAAWVDMVTTALGMPGVFTPVLWQNLHDMPPIFPNADTLGGTEADQMQTTAPYLELRFLTQGMLRVWVLQAHKLNATPSTLHRS